MHPNFVKASDEYSLPSDPTLQTRPTEHHEPQKPISLDMLYVDHSAMLKTINNGDVSLNNFDPVDELYYSSAEAVQAVAQSTDKAHHYGGLAPKL